MLIRIEGSDLPGSTCGPGPDYPDGHNGVHVALQGRKGPQDLFGLFPGDVQSASWQLECEVVGRRPDIDLRGSQINGSPGRRFIYLSWGVIEEDETFRMFRRAKLWLDVIPDNVMTAAIEAELLVGRLGLTDAKGFPLCASVRPPRIEWAPS